MGIESPCGSPQTEESRPLALTRARGNEDEYGTTAYSSIHSCEGMVAVKDYSDSRCPDKERFKLGFPLLGLRCCWSRVLVAFVFLVGFMIRVGSGSGD